MMVAVARSANDGPVLAAIATLCGLIPDVVPLRSHLVALFGGLKNSVAALDAHVESAIRFPVLPKDDFPHPAFVLAVQNKVAAAVVADLLLLADK
jgi:hypothetical protein